MVSRYEVEVRAAVIVFPGSNADTEMVRTLSSVMGFDTHRAWHLDSALPPGTDLVAIPGGFAHGDYLRCGAIAKVSPIIPALRAHAESGAPVIGVCNGFQILTELEMLPGALTRNAHLRFECRDVFVTPCASGPFTAHLPKVLRVPIAHAEGRYHASAELVSQLESDGRIALRYCDADGRVSQTANPNGSVGNIAGIYGGPHHNIFGLMPHPERMSEPLHGGTDGRLFFDSIQSWLRKAA